MIQATRCTYSLQGATGAVLAWCVLTWLLLCGYATFKQPLTLATSSGRPSEVATVEPDTNIRQQTSIDVDEPRANPQPPAFAPEMTAEIAHDVPEPPVIPPAEHRNAQARRTEALQKLDAFRSACTSWTARTTQLESSDAGRRIAADSDQLREFAAMKDVVKPDWAQLDLWERLLRSDSDPSNVQTPSIEVSRIPVLVEYLDGGMTRVAGLESQLTEMLAESDGKAVGTRLSGAATRRSDSQQSAPQGHAVVHRVCRPVVPICRPHRCHCVNCRCRCRCTRIICCPHTMHCRTRTPSRVTRVLYFR